MRVLYKLFDVGNRILNFSNGSIGVSNDLPLVGHAMNIYNLLICALS